MTSGQWKSMVIFLIAILAAGANAHDGTVNISGTIQDNTCELAPDSQNKNVDMGTVAGNQFSRSGDFSPSKIFSLNLQNCGPAAREATVTFSGTSDGQNSELFAIETEGESASGLALGIYDQTGKRISPGAASVGVPLKSGQVSVEMDFFARYVSVQDNVNSGKANVTVTFVINYS